MQDLISQSMSQFVGLGGVLCYLLAYALLQMGVIGGNGYSYALMNMAAAIMVMISLTHAFNMASLLIQISFVIISLAGILRIAYLRRRVHFTPEEQDFYDGQFPGLEPHLARKLLTAGNWVEIPDGTEIATEGATLDRLTYIAKGGARVLSAGHLIGMCDAGVFIGEMSFMDQQPASATVETAGQVRGFVISAEALRNLLERHAEIRLAMTASFSSNTRNTLRLRTLEIVAQHNPT